MICSSPTVRLDTDFVTLQVAQRHLLLSPLDIDLSHRVRSELRPALPSLPHSRTYLWSAMLIDECHRAATVTLRGSEISAPHMTCSGTRWSYWSRMSFLHSSTPAGRMSIHGAPQCRSPAARLVNPGNMKHPLCRRPSLPNKQFEEERICSNVPK